jgi:glycosyltransferase involved in cell wall biosynthesis
VRILLLAPHAYYVDRGTPIDVDILLRALSASGHQVDAVVYHEGEDRDYPGVNLHRITGPPGVERVPVGFSGTKLRCDAQLFRLASRLLRERQYDVIHAGEEAVFFAMWFKWRLGLPYVYDMDSSIAQQMVESRPLLRPLAALLNWCEARAIQSALAAAPVCNALADLAREGGARFIEVFHDISQLEAPDRPATGFLKRRLGTERSLLMYVGNLEPYQGVDLLLEAFAQAVTRGGSQDLVVVGGQAEKVAAYRQRADQLGLADRAHFLGPWPANQLGEILAEAEVLTAPRIRGINTPQKIFPFLHSGRPVLLTDLPTHTQLVDERVARLAPPDPSGFADAILELASDAELRDRLGKAGRAFVEENHLFASHQGRVDRLYRHVEQQIAPRDGGSVDG